MIELQMEQIKRPECSMVICLPQPQELLRKKLQQGGNGETNWQIGKAQCYLEWIAPLIEKDTRLDLLNTLAMRLSRFTIGQLETLNRICQKEKNLDFRRLFCLLDEWERPASLQVLEIWIPAGMQRIEQGEASVKKQPLVRRLNQEEIELVLEFFQAQFAMHMQPEEGLRRLAFYLTDKELQQKVFSIEPGFVLEEGTLYGKLVCRITEQLIQEERIRLRDILIRECSFGWGQPFTQEGIAWENGRIRLFFAENGVRMIEKEIEPMVIGPALVQRPSVLTVDVYPQVTFKKEEVDEVVSLPLSPWGLQDVLERLGEEEESHLFIAFFSSLLPELEEVLWQQTETGKAIGSLSEWNRFAWVLSQLDGFAQQGLQTILSEMEEVPSILEITWFALVLKDCLEQKGIAVVEQTETGDCCLQDSKWLLQALRQHLNHMEVKQTEQREEQEGCYRHCRHKALLLPEYQKTEKNTMIQIVLQNGRGEQETVFLPKDLEEACCQPELWQKNVREAKTVEIDCRVPALIPTIYEELEEIAQIETLSWWLLCLEENKKLVKYKAVLELLVRPTLAEAIHQANLLDQYQFYSAVWGYHAFGVQMFEQTHHVQLTEEETMTVDFAKYGKAKLVQLGGIQTSYGCICPKRLNEPEQTE